MVRRILTGFTLIELLVVITIIVVLLALLTPALDKAIYQAELAACGAKLKALSTAVTSYAMNSKRHYPVRTWMNGGVNERPILISYMTTYPALYWDDRPPLRSYVSINKTLNCPLTKAVTLDGPGIDPETSPYSPYALWWGYGYSGQKRMVRLGDGITYWSGERSTLLAGDWDGMYETALRSAAGGDICTHPDHDERMSDNHYENLPFAIAANKATFSGYQGAAPRGTVDLNYAFEAGNVERYTDVLPLTRAPAAEADERMWNWAQYWNDPSDDTGLRRVHIPKR